MLTFMNKFLEGTIFMNSYVDGVAGSIASALGANLYFKWGMRRTLFISFSLALLGGLMIYALESGRFHFPEWYLASFIDTPLSPKKPKLYKIATSRAVDHLVP